MIDHRATRARAAARILLELASLVDRYEMLERFARGPAGRTHQRRSLMRTLAARFPGALRELESIGIIAVRGRGEQACAALECALASVPAAGELPAWIRYQLQLQPRLREVLRIKRWLAVNPDADLAAWYDLPPGGNDPILTTVPSDTLVGRVVSPPGGQVQQVAYDDAAAALGITAGELKRVLYSGGDAD